MDSASVICKVENSVLTNVIDHLQNKITVVQEDAVLWGVNK